MWFQTRPPLKQGVESNKLCGCLNIKHEYTGEMSERADKVKPSSVKLTIVEVMVKSCHEWSFAVGVGEKFVVKKKGGDRGPALEVTDVHCSQSSILP